MGNENLDINQFLTERQQEMMASAVNDSYQQIGRIIEENDYFNDISIKDKFSSYAKNWFPIASIKKICDKGVFPMIYKEVPTNNRSYNHAFFSGLDKKFNLTINQVSGPNRVARPALAKKSANSNGEILLKLDGIEDDGCIPYLELNHGYQSTIPDFINLGLPSSTEKGWIPNQVLDIRGNPIERYEDYEKENVGFNDGDFGKISEDILRNIVDN